MICDKLACKLQFGHRALLLDHVIQTVKLKPESVTFAAGTVAKSLIYL